MKRVLFLLLSVFFILSCSTKKEIEYRDREVVKYNTLYIHDTTFVEKHDSVFHSVLQKGDTIYDVKYVEHTKWRDRVVERHDTCWRDSVVTQYKESVKEVPRVPKIYTAALIFSFLVLIYGLIKLTKWLKMF
jgi:hypothetical protein